MKSHKIVLAYVIANINCMRKRYPNDFNLSLEEGAGGFGRYLKN